MEKQPLKTLSMIVFFHNEEDKMKDITSTLLDQKEVDQFILIDADSTDNTRQQLYMLSEQDSRCEVYHLDTCDTCEVFNFGLEKVTSELVTFVEHIHHIPLLDKVKYYDQLAHSDLIVFTGNEERYQTSFKACGHLIAPRPIEKNIYQTALLRRYALRFNPGKDSAFIFQTMALLASETVTILPDHQKAMRSCFGRAFTYRDWQHFLLSMSWLLKAASPIGAIYDHLVTFLLKEGLAWNRASFANNDKATWRQSLIYFYSFLKEQRINYQAYPLSYKEQLIYEALDAKDWRRAMALVKGEVDETIILEGIHYVPKIRWHRSKVDVAKAITATARLSIVATATGLQCQGEMNLAGLPLLDPVVELTLTHANANQTKTLPATCYKDKLAFTLPFDLMKEVDGEWMVQGKLYTGDIAVPLVFVGDERLAFTYDKMQGMVYLNQAFYIHVDNQPLYLDLVQWQVKDSGMLLSLGQSAPYDLRLVSAQGECVMAEKEESGKEYFFSLPTTQATSWQLVGLLYRHQKNWQKVYFSRVVNDVKSESIWEWRLCANQSGVMLNVDRPKTVAKLSLNSEMILSLEENIYLKNGYQAKCLLLCGKNHQQCYPIENNKVQFSLYNEVHWMIAADSYQLKVIYTKQEEEIESLIQVEAQWCTKHQMSLSIDGATMEVGVEHQLSKGNRKLSYLLERNTQRQPIVLLWLDQSYPEMATLLSYLERLNYQVIYAIHTTEAQVSVDGKWVLRDSAKASHYLAKSEIIITDCFLPEYFSKATKQRVYVLGIKEEQLFKVQTMLKNTVAVTQKKYMQQWQLSDGVFVSCKEGLTPLFAEQLPEIVVNTSQQMKEEIVTQLKEPSHYQSQSVILRPFIHQWSHRLYEQLFHVVGLLPSKKTMVFESFYGKKYSDNPRALYEYAKEHYPDYRLVWNATKESATLFEAEQVPYVINNSLRALFVQARAQYWILNTRMVPWKQPPRHTTVIQTWHGTPLKKLGLDIDKVTMPGVTTEEYYQQFLEDTKKWDYLIVPNEYTLNIFRSAFNIQTEQMIPSGYPRNDCLHYVTSSETERMKKKLAIDPNKKVILYAPTWRDDENYGQGNYHMTLALDIERLRQQFADEAVLLIRSHYFINQDLVNEDDFVRDVSSYQEVSDLYIASDVLITDYSSVFFDYALLKRPMIFYAYDYEKYKEGTRGFYFDYDTVPGEIVTNEADLVFAIQQALNQKRLHKNHLAFLKKYAHLEDGHASEKVFEMVMNQKQWHAEKTKKETEEIVLLGTGEMHTEKTAISLKEDCGRKVKVQSMYRLHSPLDGKAYGEKYYMVQLDEQIGAISSDDIEDER